ncbi:MAG: hypothetical protein OHK0022_07080 [Roseiflexaceae bacterium]
MTLLAGVLCLWALAYALLLPSYSRWNDGQQQLFRYSPAITLAGVAVLVVAALRGTHPQQTRSYRGACWALLGVQLLNGLALLLQAEPYRVGPRLNFAQGIVIFVLIYMVLLVSIFLLAPVWSLPRITLLRLTVENALVMATVDVLLRLLLPWLVPGWTWTPALIACAFRLETTIGLFIWYARIYRLFGPAPLPLGLWIAGFAFLTLNDTIVLWRSAFLEPGRTVVREAVPFWMVNQTLWGLALYRCRQIPLQWEGQSRPARSRGDKRLWLAPFRRAALVVGLTLTVAFAPSVVSTAWFVVALIGRELLASYERQRLEFAERQAQQETERANAELAQADREKAALLERRQIAAAEIAHDVGAAVQDVRLAVDALRRVLPPNGSHEEQLTAAQASTEFIGDLLVALVAAAQLDAGALQLHLQPASVEQVVARVVRQQVPSANAAGVRVLLDLASGLPPVWCDPQLLQRALANIVSNAIKYTGAARSGTGLVFLSAERQGDHIQITVTDNGPGIAPDDLTRVRQQFARGTGAGAPAGFGLGLSFAYGVIEQHPGGTLRIESELDAGTSVLITLAIAGAPPQETAV